VQLQVGVQRARATIIAALLALGAFGCTAGPTHAPTIELTESPFTAQTLTCNGRGLGGSLVLQARDGSVVAVNGSRVVDIRWPSGFHAVLSPSLVVFDEHGGVFANGGDDLAPYVQFNEVRGIRSCYDGSRLDLWRGPAGPSGS
jgi:hypothetical protein